MDKRMHKMKFVHEEVPSDTKVKFYGIPTNKKVNPEASPRNNGLTGNFRFSVSKLFGISPYGRVGEACPFVRPYTPLSKSM